MKGLSETVAALARRREALDAAAREVVEVAGMLVVASTMTQFQGSHAPHMPHTGGAAPNIVTGDLRRSIQADPVSAFGDHGFHTEVAPRMVYGRRVELGMTGSDSRGRAFNQPPHPFFQPGVDKARSDIGEHARAVVAKHLAGI